MAMALPFGVSWLHTLLLWSCICFPQKGYNIAHGYTLKNEEFSSHADMLGPQTSNQFHYGPSLNTNQDYVTPSDEMQAMRHQSFVSLQRDPVHQENNEDTSLSEEVVQSNPDSENDAPSMKYERDGSGYQHPFGQLVKEHTQEKSEGTSFPTIKDFKRFIETMKRSFLTPDGDMERHFQSARETVENELATNSQNVKREHDIVYRFKSPKGGTAHDDASENEVLSEAMNTAFEQSEQGANYQMPSESLSVRDPVDSTVRLISTSIYDSQDLSPGPALYPRHHLAATEHVPSHYGSFDSGGISGENPYIFTRSPYVRNEDVQNYYKLPEQIPSGSFFGEYLSFSGRMTAPPVISPNSPSQDFSDSSSTTSNIMPLTSENIKQPKYPPRSKDTITGYRKPSGGFEHKDFQSEERGRVTPANVPSAPMPPALNSYGKSVYVSTPKGQLHIQDYLPKQRERPAKSFQAYQPTADKKSVSINYTPTAHLPPATGSLFLSSNNPSPQSSSGHVGVQTSSPHDAQQPVRSHLMFSVKPSSSLHGSSGHDGYTSVGRPSALTAQAKEEEKPDPSERTLVSATRGSKQMSDNTVIPISSSFDSTHSGLASRDGDANFDSLTNLAPNSAQMGAFSRLVGNEVMSRNFDIKNIISDIRGAGNQLGSFSTPLRRGISLNGDYVSGARAGPLQTFIQPTKLLKRLANVNKKTPNMSYQLPQLWSASKGSASTPSDVFWGSGGNTKRLLPQMGPNMSSPPSVNTHVMKSRNRYVRSKESLSMTRFTPHQLDEYRNTASHTVKGFEEQ